MTHLFYNTARNDDEILTYFKMSYPPKTYDCYSCYDSYYNGDDSKEKFYTGFYAHPNILYLINEINQLFNNIKVRVVLFNVFPFVTDIGFYRDGDKFRIYDRHDEFTPEKYTYCLFTVELNNEYSQKSKYVLTLAISQFLRGFNPELQCFIKSSKIEKDYIKGMLKSQNTRKYGDWLCLSDSNKLECDLETFKKFDHTEFINNTTDYVDLNYQPSISLFINKIRDE